MSATDPEEGMRYQSKFLEEICVLVFSCNINIREKISRGGADDIVDVGKLDLLPGTTLRQT